jgi:hypothetical protein
MNDELKMKGGWKESSGSGVFQDTKPSAAFEVLGAVTKKRTIS